MIEATKPYKIDELIKELENGVKSENMTLPSIPKIEKNNPKIEQNSENLFEKLKKELYDRDVEIYKCFKDVKFISYENGVLKWESCVDDECKKILRKYWNAVIKVIIDDIFGIGTKVIPEKCSKIKEEKKEEKKIIEIKKDPKDEIVKKAQEVFGDEIMEVNIYKN